MTALWATPAFHQVIGAQLDDLWSAIQGVFT